MTVDKVVSDLKNAINDMNNFINKLPEILTKMDSDYANAKDKYLHEAEDAKGIKAQYQEALRLLGIPEEEIPQ